MLNKESLYVIWLEDYHLPRFAAVPKPYLGTRAEIEEFVSELAQIPWACDRYWGMINLINSCRDWDVCDITHTVAGQQVRLLTKVKECFRMAGCLEEAAWDYKVFTGNSFPMTAECIEVEQVLVQWEDGRYVRCVKASFQNLMLRCAGIGWCRLEDNGRGFPCVYEHVDDKYIPRLHTAQRVYEADQREQAIADMWNMDKVNLSTVCEDIMGEM